MNGTQVIEFHRLLKKHKYTDQEADKFIEFVENRGVELVTKKDLEPLRRDINWLKWVIGIGFTLLVALFVGVLGTVYYLHSDTKVDIRELRTEIKDIRTEIKDIRTEIKDVKTEIKDIRTDMKETKADIKEIKALIKSR